MGGVPGELLHPLFWENSPNDACLGPIFSEESQLRGRGPRIGLLKVIFNLVSYLEQVVFTANTSHQLSVERRGPSRVPLSLFQVGEGLHREL